jgi:hypothetical protein
MICNLADLNLCRSGVAFRKRKPRLCHDKQACFIVRYAAAFCEFEAACREGSVLVLFTHGSCVPDLSGRCHQGRHDPDITAVARPLPVNRFRTAVLKLIVAVRSSVNLLIAVWDRGIAANVAKLPDFLRKK